MKFAFALVWTIFAIAVTTAVIAPIVRDNRYTGTVIDINTGRNLKIEGSDITIFATSQSFFLLREEKGLVLYSLPPVPPHTEWIIGPTNIPGGNWNFREGSAVVHMTSASTINVLATTPDKGFQVFMILLIATILWVLILCWIAVE